MGDDGKGNQTGKSGPSSLANLALFALVVLVWGTSWIGIRWQVGVVAPEVSVLWRFVIACPLMFAWCFAAGERLAFPLPAHVSFAGMGATMFSLNLIMFYNAGLLIPTGLLAVVFSLASIFNLVLSVVFFGQRIHVQLVLGSVAGVTGVALMFAPEILSHELDRSALIGLATSIAATLCFCSGNIVSAATQGRGIPVLSSMAWSMLYGVIILLVFSLARGQPLIVEWSLRYMGSLVWLAVVASVIAFAAFLTLIGRTSAAQAGYMTVLFPVVALAVSTVLEGYRWIPLAILGLVLVIAGNVMVLWGSRR
jgi:drug/metabolite transporter (DMT)-like permease